MTCRRGPWRGEHAVQAESRAPAVKSGAPLFEALLLSALSGSLLRNLEIPGAFFRTYKLRGSDETFFSRAAPIFFSP